MSDKTLDTPVAALREYELTDDEVEMVANYTKPSWAERDFHSRSVVPVKYVDGEIEIARPRSIEGGTTVRWSDEVLFTFGADPISEEGVREAFSRGKARLSSR